VSAGLLIAALWALAAQDPAAGGGVLDIAAESADIRQEEGITILTGNVRVVRGDGVLTAPRMVVYASPDGSGVDRLEAEGGVRYARPGEAISGDRAVYDDRTRLITVTGDVLIVQGRQVARGARLVYHVDTQRTQLYGAPGARVRGLFYTEPDAPASR